LRGFEKGVFTLILDAALPTAFFAATLGIFSGISLVAVGLLG
jgi:hypothetical protein